MRPELLKQARFCLVGSLIILLFASCIASKKSHFLCSPLSNSQWGMNKDTANQWLSWNILLKDGLTEAERNVSIIELEARIHYYLINFPGYENYKAKFSIYRCKCDSSLINVNVKVVDGQDRSVSPPPGSPGTGGGGDILFVSVNHDLQKELPSKDSLPRGKLTLSRTSTVSDEILAIIDTGLDPSCFTSEINNLIWKAPPGKLALYNFLGGSYGDKNNKDDHPKKHGSGVAAVSIMAMDGGVYPKLMILKALDKDKRGTTFTFNCALSYAIQNKATIVNASLGYEETTSQAGDPILFNYLRKAKDTVPDHPIYVFTAAGNMNTTGNDICADGPSANELRPGIHMFYPGCFSNTLSNVINVTGLTKPDQSCRYQKYSNVFVTLGVLNNPNCCIFKTPFFSFGFDGTSFATPAAAGMVMNMHLAPGAKPIPTCINDLSQTSNSPNPKTVGGRFFTYTHSQ